MLLFRWLTRSVVCRVVVPSVFLSGSLFLCSLASPANPAIAAPAPSPLAQGAELFQRGDFDKALVYFRQAQASQPKDVLTQMWLGLGYEGTGEIGRAHAAWAYGNSDPKFEKVAFYLKGLDFWRRGDLRSAAYFFQASLKNSANYAPAQQALVELQTGGLIPVIQRWPALAELPLPSASQAAVPAAPAPSPFPLAQATPAPLPGAKPRPGRWEAKVSNGYRGDRLTFRVSRDGKRIEKLEFTGSWNTRGGSIGIQTLKNQNPPAPFALSEGNFGATQHAEKSRLWWEASGRFLSTRTAEGTYRCASASGESDTYKLKWTARWVGR